MRQFIGRDNQGALLEQEIRAIFTIFAQNTPIYDQVRLLSADGMEVIRINRQGDAVFAVPDSGLQDKSDRPYFQETRTLASGEIYVSPLDLNQEFNQIEVPYKPVVRYAMPIFKADGELGGVLVLNVLVQQIFDKTLMPDGFHTRYLVNSAGDFIYTDDSQKDILYATDLGHDIRLDGLFPQIALTQPHQDEGFIINSQQNWFLTYTTMYISTPQHEWHWLLIDKQPLSIALQSVNASLGSLRNIGLVALIVTVVLASLITKSLVRPVRVLSHAVQSLRERSWEEAVKLTQMIKTKDEVGKLAEAFEDMLHALQNIYSTLEERVAIRTLELEEANAQLQKLDEIKVKFMEDMAHEIRTPLSSIALNVEMINRQPANYEKYVNRINQNIQHISRLVENVSVVTRLDSVSARPEFAPLRFNEVVTPVIEMYRTLATENGLALVYEADEVLPVTYGHHNQLSQVVDNLITNAIKYTDTGTIHVALYHQKDAAQVCLTVQDTGIGIAADDLNHLFERYYRAQHVRQSAIPGTGLGLSIAQEIIQWHSGTIEAQSERGKGTTVRVYLPVQ